ncbi:MAG: PEP-CTERM sorting domain-containing protein [Pirellulales bacterium]
MRRINLAAALIAALTTAGSAMATDVNWIGVGSGSWDVGANWDNGTIVGTAVEVFGRDDGWYNSATPITADADAIIGAGDDVKVEQQFTGDFRWNAGASGQMPAFGLGGSLTVEGGGHLDIQSRAADDGEWSEWDADSVTITGAGSLLERTKGGTALNGGNFIFGSWRGYDQQEMELNVLDGGRLENDGQLNMGAAGDNQSGLTVRMTVGALASVDLTNGGIDSGANNDDSACEDGAGGVTECQGDMNLIYGADSSNGMFKDEDYSINFTGHGGSLEVDHNGFWLQEQTGAETGGGSDIYVATKVSFEELYAGVTTVNPNAGGPNSLPANLATKQILRASGSNAAAFGDVFAVQNGSGDDGYRVTSIQGAGEFGSHRSDINGDTFVDGSDASSLIANFGATGAGAVLANGDIVDDDIIDAADASFLIADFSTAPDPGPADGSVGDAIAEYNIFTGRIIVSVDQVENWFVESLSGGMIGPDNASAVLPLSGGLVSDNPLRFGEWLPSGNISFTNEDFGRVALPGLEDIRIFYNGSGSNQPKREGIVNVVVPEPTSLVLIGLCLGGVLASRRRLAA